MSVRPFHPLGFALAVLVASPLALAADDAPKGRPTPIIFSAPKADTVASNLNQLGAKSSPLIDLESGLKRPFEIFDAGRSSGGVQLPNQFLPPGSASPGISDKRLKDMLDKRAEESYLLSEDDDPRQSRDELSSLDNGPLNSSRRPKTSLDIYYDRIDRMRAGPTNQTSGSLDLFGEKERSEEKDGEKPPKSGGLFDRELSVHARALSQMSNGVSESRSFFSEKLIPRAFGDSFEPGPVRSVQQTTRTKETRFEEFKRLLDGPGYSARGEFNVTPPPSSSATYQPPKSTMPAPGSSLSVGLRPAGGSYANPSGFSGAVGVPAAVPEFAAGSPSLTTTPAVPQSTPKPPVPVFKIPRGRF